MKVELKDALPETFAHPQRAWIEALLESPSEQWVKNANTKVKFLQVGEWGFPVTISEGNWESTYVTSPYTAYVSYAIEELRELKSPFLEFGLRQFLKGLGAVMKKAQMNHVVMVNNFMVSTNLYPKSWRGDSLERLTDVIRNRYPDHAIVFRSLTPALHEPLMNQFREVGYDFLPSRRIYLVDSSQKRYRRLRDVRKDRSLLLKNDYIKVGAGEMGKDDIPRILELYRQLYLEKYSWNNPVFTERLVQKWWETDTLYLEGLRHPQSGRLDGVFGSIELEDYLTVPLLGYERSVPVEAGLYRMLSTMILQRAESRELMLHCSSGAASFKRNRGGVPFLEYSAVMTDHLPNSRRLAWRSLKVVLDRVGVPLLEKFGL